MILKKAVYKKQMVEQNVLVSDDLYGCDECNTELHEDDERLELTVFFKKTSKEPKRLHFCSWDCVLKNLKKIKCDYFVDLPYLFYDQGKSKSGTNRLIELIEKIK